MSQIISCWEDEALDNMHTHRQVPARNYLLGVINFSKKQVSEAS